MNAERTETDAASTDNMVESRDSRKLSTADIASVRTRDEQAAQSEAIRQEPANGRGASDAAGPQPLFPATDAERFRSQWSTIQTGFVDEPRRAVEQGDELVAEVVQRLTETFASERAGLEEQWGRGDQVSTEDLRVALQRYRSFFERLLAA